MKNRASAFAALLALGATFGATCAHGEVTLYGKVDVGYVHETGGPDGTVDKLSTGVMLPSRLGVKASFDIGDGMKAKGQLETGVCADSNNNPGAPYCTGGGFMGRKAILALEGAFGELSLGRQYTPAFLNLDNFDPFGTGLAGTSTNLFGFAGLRANNSVVYSMPALGGLSASLLYAFGEKAGDRGANRRLGGSVGFETGPFAIGAAHNELRAENGSKAKDSNIGLSVDLKAAKLNGIYQRSTGKNVYLVGGSVPLLGGSLIGSYIRLDDRTGAGKDASQVGVGYTRPMNKVLTAYAAYAHITNKRGAGYVVGNATDDGSGDGAFNLGFVLSF
jgi:predicted porin